MLNDIEIYILLFFSYSFTGWLMEVIVKLIQYKRFINRGFLIGPYCPIYGWGAILITLLLKKYLDDPLALFLFGMFICSILEYYTSYFMEKLFNARWWDYSTKKFNINGRICLDTMIPFGLLGMLIMYVINPFLFNIYYSINFTIITSLCGCLIIVYVIDNILTIMALNLVKNDKDLNELDNTEEISKKIMELLSSKNWKERRLIKAFPNIKFIDVSIKKKIKKLQKDFKKKIDKEKSKSEKKINKLKSKMRLK